MFTRVILQALPFSDSLRVLSYLKEWVAYPEKVSIYKHWKYSGCDHRSGQKNDQSPMAAFCYIIGHTLRIIHLEFFSVVRLSLCVGSQLCCCRSIITN